MERFSSRLGFLLAVVGAAVGLGNVWRFSAVVGGNGGGAYLVPYLLAAFAFAVPLPVLEIAVGRHPGLDVAPADASPGGLTGCRDRGRGPVPIGSCWPPPGHRPVGDFSQEERELIRDCF